MPDANRNGRKHFYVSALVLAYLGVVIVGTCILWLGTKCKNRGAREPQHILTGMDDAAEAAPELPPAKAGLSRRCSRVLFALAFSVTYAICLAAAFASSATGRLSHDLGLCWEAYLILFAMAGGWLLLQACIAALILPRGRRYGLRTFPSASLSGMCPFISDAYDTLKDAIFAALCLQSEAVVVKIVGVLSLVHLAGLHIYYSFFDDKCLAQLCGSHLSVLMASTEDTEPEASSSQKLSFCRWLCSKIAPPLYKLVTPTKRKLLLLENLPQAIFAMIYLKVNGGSLFVGLLNLAIPVSQLILANMSYGSLRRCSAPWQGERLNSALEDNNELMEQRIRDEADFAHDLEFFRLVVPHCDAFNDVFPELDDIQDVDTERLRELCVACEFITSRSRVAIRCDDLDETFVEAIATALRSHSRVQQVHLEAKSMDAECAQLIATLLDKSSPVQAVTLDIVQPGGMGESEAEELADALLESNSGLRRLFFFHDQIGEERAEAIASAMDGFWNEVQAMEKGFDMDCPKRLLCNSTEIGEEGVE
ncbi:unnamed protein product, partial [Symbiodinium pilosum]